MVARVRALQPRRAGAAGGRRGPLAARLARRPAATPSYFVRAAARARRPRRSGRPTPSRCGPSRRASSSQFFDNHGMLSFRDRPQWRTVVGGSRQLRRRDRRRPRATRLRLATPGRAVRRDRRRRRRRPAGGEPERFDEVVLACHSDQALAMLDDADRRPSARCSARSPTSRSELRPALRHVAAAAAPRGAGRAGTPTSSSGAAAADRHLRPEPPAGPAHRAPGARHAEPHRADRPGDGPRRRCEFAHPIYTPEGVAAQARHGEISGADRIALRRRLLELGLPRGRRRAAPTASPADRSPRAPEAIAA